MQHTKWWYWDISYHNTEGCSYGKPPHRYVSIPLAESRLEVWFLYLTILPVRAKSRIAYSNHPSYYYQGSKRKNCLGTSLSEETRGWRISTVLIIPRICLHSYRFVRASFVCLLALRPNWSDRGLPEMILPVWTCKSWITTMIQVDRVARGYIGGIINLFLIVGPPVFSYAVSGIEFRELE
jgi:hypothetical protein